MNWNSFLDFITKPVPAITSFALVFCTGFLLFAPDKVLAQLGLTHALMQYRGYIGIGFVFFMSWLLVTVVVGAYQVSTSHFNQRRFKREEHKFLGREIERLSANEREIIGCLLYRNERMFTNTDDCGYANTLLSKGFVRRAVRPGQSVTYFEVPFDVPEHIWKLLVERKADFPYDPDEENPLVGR